MWKSSLISIFLFSLKLLNLDRCDAFLQLMMPLTSTTNQNQSARSRRQTTSYVLANSDKDLKRSPGSTRSIFLRTGLVSAFFGTEAAFGFDGGVGGLGKTKPTTGVTLFEENSAPIQNDKGIVSAEIRSISGKPILVEFQTPWPLLPTASGLEARDLRSSESAFVQLVPTVPDWRNRKIFQQLLINTILASQGKYGAYGTPTDIRVKPYSSETGIYAVSFTSYTPGMRESERQVWVKPIEVDDSLVMLVTGTTRNAFPSQERTFSKISASFLAVAAPESRLRVK